MIKHLYLMRHGETLFNQRKKIQGHCDSPLTLAGIQQAKLASAYLKHEHINFDHVYCSTSERCVDTVELVTSLPYCRLKGLKEMNYGMFEGESEDLKPKDPKAFESFFLPYGGESSNMVKERMVHTLSEVMEQEAHECVLALSHSGACYNFLRAWQDPQEELAKGFGNCCIFHYIYEHKSFRLCKVIRLEEMREYENQSN